MTAAGTYAHQTSAPIGVGVRLEPDRLAVLEERPEVGREPGDDPREQRAPARARDERVERQRELLAVRRDPQRAPILRDHADLGPGQTADEPPGTEGRQLGVVEVIPAQARARHEVSPPEGPADGENDEYRPGGAEDRGEARCGERSAERPGDPPERDPRRGAGEREPEGRGGHPVRCVGVLRKNLEHSPIRA
jgi:hypothetical protein